MLLNKGQLEFLGRPKSITTIYQRITNTRDHDWQREAQRIFTELEGGCEELTNQERKQPSETSSDFNQWLHLI